MIRKIKKFIYRFLLSKEYEITNIKSNFERIEPEFYEQYNKTRKFTMTSIHRMYATYIATKYCVENNLKGDFVECGVWKGGNCMMIALTLKKLNSENKMIYLYDTYEGMTSPTKNDISLNRNMDVKSIWKNSQTKTHNTWCYSSLEEVKRNMSLTNYPQNKLRFIKGDVNNTLEEEKPQTIALLRLDTDFYDSTKKEMEVLYPKLIKGGVLLIDDYDSWQGARKAIDEYFQKHNIRPLLMLTGNGGRIMIKQ